MTSEVEIPLYISNEVASAGRDRNTERFYWSIVLLKVIFDCESLLKGFISSDNFIMSLTPFVHCALRSPSDWLPLHHSTRHLNEPAWCPTATATGATTTTVAAARHTAFYTNGLPRLHFSGPGRPRLTPANAAIKSTWAFTPEGAEPATGWGPSQWRLG